MLYAAQKVSLWPSQAYVSCESVFFREPKICCFSFVLAVSSLGTFHNGFLVGYVKHTIVVKGYNVYYLMTFYV